MSSKWDSIKVGDYLFDGVIPHHKIGVVKAKSTNIVNIHWLSHVVDIDKDSKVMGRVSIISEQLDKATLEPALNLNLICIWKDYVATSIFDLEMNELLGDYTQVDRSALMPIAKKKGRKKKSS
jgi:hypothetical protein